MRAAKVLVADPAWKPKDKLPGGRGAEAQYPCMDTPAICTMELPKIATDAWLFLWRLSSMQIDAWAVGRAWGFGDPYTELVWDKLTTHGKPFFAMGRLFRSSHETCLVFRRGRPERLRKDVRSRFEAKAPTYESLGLIPPKGERPSNYVHSAKPEEFYAIVEALVPGPRVEMFARRSRPGWTCLGNQVDKLKKRK